MKSLRDLAFACTLFAAGVLSLAHCTWEPLTRPVQPELVKPGLFRVDRLLDWEGRRVLVEETVGEKSHWHLLTTEKMTSCLLPEGRPVSRPLVAPGLRGKDIPKLLMPLRRRVGEVDELWLFDEKCGARGPFGELGEEDPELLAVRPDGRNVMVVLDPTRALRLVDPWTNTIANISPRIARGGGAWAPDARGPAGARGREADTLWVLEEGHLRQRALDGTLLVDIGERVVAFDQLSSADGSRLRIAYQENREVFEALSPDYNPVRIASDACGPTYVGEALDVHTPIQQNVPCGESQLVRVEPGGRVKFFAAGVYRVFPYGEITLQLVRNPMGESEFWIETETAMRVKLTPTPVSPISVLDTGRIAARTRDGRFGLWSLRNGFQPALSGVRDMLAYRTDRTSQHLWLVYHDRDPSLPSQENTPGRLSTFDERSVYRALDAGTQVELKPLADNVPGGGFQPYYPPFYEEPIVLISELNMPSTPDEMPRATLNARLLSGRLGSRIDEGVTSSTLVVAPQPGVLYAIREGERAGLWFAAL